MKDSYTIHEIAALYGVGPDALRYYEKLGLIKSAAGRENGYRIYDLNDIYRLTILRDLRSLGFSMERIGEYLKDLSVGNTLQLLGRGAAAHPRSAARAARRRVRHPRAGAPFAGLRGGGGRRHFPCGTAAAPLPAPQRRHRPR